MYNYENFESYVYGMSDECMFSTLKEEYINLKGKFLYAPSMGANGSIEFAASLLLFKYLKNNASTGVQPYAGCMIPVGNLIGCVFNQMPPLEFSNQIYALIKLYEDILTYSMWRNVYHYLIETYSEKIREFEFNDSGLSMEARGEIFNEFMKSYSSTTNFASIFRLYSRQGLSIEKQLGFAVAN